MPVNDLRTNGTCLTQALGEFTLRTHFMSTNVFPCKPIRFIKAVKHSALDYSGLMFQLWQARARLTAFILLCITDICMLLSAQSFIALQINTAHSLVTDAVLPFAHSAHKVWRVDLCHWASSTHFYAN